MYISDMMALAQIETDVYVPAQDYLQDHQYTWDTLTEEQREILGKCEVDPDNMLSDEQKQKVKDLLAKHMTAFAGCSPDTNNKRPGASHLSEVTLQLKKGAVPHRHAPARLGKVGAEIVQKAVDEMEKNGIVQRSNSARASRLVVVKKKGAEGQPPEYSRPGV